MARNSSQSSWSGRRRNTLVPISTTSKTPRGSVGMFLQRRLELFDDAVPREAGQDAPADLVANAAGEVPVVEEPDDGVRGLLAVAAVHDDAGLAVGHCLADPPGGSGNRGQPGGRGFEVHEGEPFGLQAPEAFTGGHR